MNPPETLPTGWTKVSLGALGSWSGGGTPSKSNPAFWTEGTVPWVSPKDMKTERIRSAEDSITLAAVENSAAKMIPSNSVLMVTRSGILAHSFPVAVTECEVTVNQDLKTLTPHNDIETDYVAWYLRGQALRVLADCSKHGTTVASIDTDRLKNFPVPLAPVNEQRRVVERIETLFARLDNGEEAVREVQKLLTRYRQSVLKAAITGQLTIDWRAEHGGKSEDGSKRLERILEDRQDKWEGRRSYKEPFAPNTEELAAIPEGWAWASLDQLISHLTSGSRDWKQYYGRGDGTFIMAQNVRPMRFDLSERFLVDPPLHNPDAKRSEVRQGDLLITIVGANTGDVCRFPLDEGAHYVCQSVALARPVDQGMSEYLELYLASEGAGRDELDKYIYGAGRPHLSFEQLRSVIVPLPPEDEQAELQLIVAEHLERIRTVQALCETELKRSAALRQSILKDAFAGRLVPQDPSDEPASDLLARIAAEKTPAKKNRRKVQA